ncbi:shikimate dehydrogenase family protein [Aureimonas endophytica]|nr:shikimate dehydrogenase [Aureimonas endophytica]
MRVFPAWARHLGLGEAVIKGLDFPLHADPAAYREAVAFIKADPLSLGALVTTHKIDLFKACRDLFDEIDPLAAAMDETSCLSKRQGRLVCHAKDPITSGLALDAFLPPDHFAQTGAELLSIGAGGSTIAIVWALTRLERGANRPSRITVSDRDPERLAEIRRLHAALPPGVPIHYVLAETPVTNDALVGGLKPGSLTVNATGLGKDAPGSPLTEAARFPNGGIAWDLNYRGDLVFLDQARAQADASDLQVENGWVYFIHGWTRVIAEVFAIDIPTAGPDFDAISRIADDLGKAA